MPQTFVADTLADENDGDDLSGNFSLREAIVLGDPPQNGALAEVVVEPVFGLFEDNDQTEAWNSALASQFLTGVPTTDLALLALLEGQAVTIEHAAEPIEIGNGQSEQSDESAALFDSALEDVFAELGIG